MTDKFPTEQPGKGLNARHIASGEGDKPNIDEGGFHGW
jgi:hypothetical protein